MHQQNYVLCLQNATVKQKSHVVIIKTSLKVYLKLNIILKDSAGYEFCRSRGQIQWSMKSFFKYLIT